MEFIKRCFELAQCGSGWVSPNPMVGAVIVHQGKIIGEGWHQQYGGPHAEVNAIRSVKNPQLLPESTLYCSLEPCSHFGKTPPCADLILAHKIPKVVIANTDPNPLVAGKGIQKLLDNGVEVISGVLEKEGAWLNRIFFNWIQQQRPHIILKWAQSQDGFIGKKGEQTAISSPITQRLTHQWRAETDAILVGTNTALTDNPQLNNRFWGNKQPLRVAIDLKNKIPQHFHLLDDHTPTWIIGPKLDGEWQQTKFFPWANSEWVPQLLKMLFTEKKAALLVEGGAAMHQTLLNMDLWDEIRVITNKRFLKEGISAPLLPPQGTLVETRQIGEDTVQWWSKQPL